MKQRTGVIVMIPALVLALVGLVLLNARTPLASAQSIVTVMEAQAQQNNTGEWTINENVFESNYPHGFTVRLKADSSGGEIVRARLIWYRPTLRAGQTLSITAEEGVIDPATGTITASWLPDDRQMVPPWVMIKYHWELRDAANNVYKTDPELGEYADNTHDWTRSESDDAIVFTSDLSGDVESLVLDAMAQRHDDYVAVWGSPLPYKPRIILFGDYDAWMEWRTADHNVSETSVVVGQTFDQWGAIVQVLFGKDDEQAYQDLAYGTVVHEVEHLYQNEFLAARKKFDVPGWFFEGDATFFEISQSYDYLARVQDIARAGDLPPMLADSVSGPRVDGENPRDGYDIGYSFFVWMESLHGDLSVQHDLMALLAQDVGFFDALEAVTGMSTTEIERSWRTWLGATPDAPTLIPTWTPPSFLPTPTLMQFGK